MLHFPQYVSFSLSHHQGGTILWNIHYTVYECAITLVGTTHAPSMYVQRTAVPDTVSSVQH